MRLITIGVAFLALSVSAAQDKPAPPTNLAVVGNPCATNGDAVGGAAGGYVCVDHKWQAVAAATALKPTEVQALRLQVRQKDALLAKAALEQAQHAFQQTLLDLTAEADKIKLENGWHDAVFDPNTLGFAPAPPAKKEEHK